IKYAKVTTVSGDVWRVTFLGESIESQKVHTKLANYTATLGDTVAFIVDKDNKYLCIGKV
ncbi:MAG: hypothetical protein ACRCX8_09880, partial [Sarcina sp.]